MDYSPPGASVHGVLQTRTLEWVAISFSREFPDPGMEPLSLTAPALVGGFFTTSATWETQHRRWKCFIVILALVFSISVPMLMYLLSHCTSALQIWKIETLCLVALLFIIFCLTVPETFFLNPTWVSECRSVVSDSLRPHELCSPPGSSIHGIFQARILESVAISFSRKSSWPRDWTQVSRIVGRRFTVWATKSHLLKCIQGYGFRKNAGLFYI